MKTAVVAGATGLVGSQLVKQLAASSIYDRVVVLTRRPIDIDLPGCEVRLTDFDHPDAAWDNILSADIFCCLGTTIKKAKTKEAFRKIDYQYPLELARLGKRHGSSRYFLISALGADAGSRVFYNQVKGETEQAICTIGFDAVHIFRPSLLMGDRKEVRSGEEAAKVFFTWMGFLIPKRYKGIHAETVAGAMVRAARSDVRGMVIHESAEMRETV